MTVRSPCDELHFPPYQLLLRSAERIPYMHFMVNSRIAQVATFRDCSSSVRVEVLYAVTRTQRV
jgi:hypothetical protein